MRPDPWAEKPARRIQKRGKIQKAHRLSGRKVRGVVVVETGLEVIAGLGAELDPRVASWRPQPFTFDLVSGETAATKDALIDRFRGSCEKPRPYTPDHLFRMRDAGDGPGAVRGRRGGGEHPGHRGPLVNPRGPAKKSVLRTALTSRPAACGRLDSRLLVPSLGLAPSGPTQALFKIAPGNFVLSRFASGRHPWRPALVIRSPVRRFQRGLNTRATFRR